MIYVVIGATAGWFLYKPFFFHLITAPVTGYLNKHGGNLLITGPAEGFVIKMQMCLIIGFILAMPFVLWEIWAFVAPGLTRKERRSARFLAPLSVFLFVLGVFATYLILPAAINWLGSQNPSEAVYMPSVKETLRFILLMCLAFGVAFQLPLILMFLSMLGIVSSQKLKTYWRYWVVVLLIVGTLITPSNDIPSNAVMCITLVVLYFLSIGLVKLVEKSKQR
jgi:sec-independent protein translocase protein TatC